MKLGTRNENLGIRMSAKFFLLLMISALFAFGLVSCADEDGLHDQNALVVKFEISGLGDDVSGSYFVTGEFDDWKQNYPVTLSKGAGSVEGIPLTITSMKFSVCDENWGRAWYPTLEGNQADENSSGKYWNFYIEGLELGAGEATIAISSDNLDSNGRIEPKVTY